MLIRNFDYMEKWMSITYEDIRKQRYKLDELYSKRQRKLQDLAHKLVREYKDSLSLPSDVWTDSKGVERPYVTVGTVNDKGNYQQGSVNTAKLDEDYKINFVISTVIDDSPFDGGQHYLLSISMSYRDGDLIVGVANEMKKIIVSSPESELAFAQVCGVMKQVLISALTDPRLE